MFKRADQESAMEKVEMKEVQFDATKHFVGQAPERVSERFLDLLRSEAEALAKDLVTQGLIKTFRLVPIGAALTTDAVRGRLTLALDATGKVVSADQE